jgi:diguanylate cyclase (GGDEF)-like protein
VAFLNLRIRGRLYVGFGVLLLLCVGLAGFGVRQLGEIRSQVAAMTLQSHKVIRVGEIATNLEAIRRAILRYAFDHDETSYAEAETRLRKSSELLEEAGKTTISEERRAVFKDISKAVEDLKAKRLALREAVKQMIAGRDLLFTEGDKMAADIQKFVDAAGKTEFAREASALEAEILLVRVANWRMLATRDATGIAAFKTNTGKAQQKVAELEKAALPPNLAALLAPVKTDLTNYAEAFDKAAPKLLLGSEVYYKAIVPLTVSTIGKLDAVREAIGKNMTKTAVDTEDRINSTETMQEVVAGTAVLLGLLIAFLIARGIIGPLSGLTAGMKELAGGNFGVMLPGLDRKDELGDMAQAVETFKVRANERAREDASHQVDFASRHDPLTGLPNRTACEERIGEIIETARLEGRKVAIYKLNIASLHEINEVVGGDGGDELLVEVSRRLKATVASTVFLARLSGTRFAVVTECGDVLEVQAISKAIFESLASSVQIKHRMIKLRFRMGVVMFPSDGNNQGLLMANANIALERARRFSGNGVCFYDEATDHRIHRRRTLSQDMQRALDLGQFELYFQPQCDLVAMEIVGFEGLLRWHHPALGFVPPDEFIPIAEETGLIVPIGRWVLKEGCKIASSWPETLKVALNLSPVQLRSPIGDMVMDAIGSSGLSPGRLELEITESTLIESPEHTLKELQLLQNFGISIALDDFGTGYSSLGTLSSFAFNKVKLDKSFLDWKKPTLQVEAIVGALMKIGQKLGMKILAEGVETEEQLEFLKAEGCDYMQGHLIGKPMPANKISEWMSEFADRQTFRKVSPTLLQARTPVGEA